MRLKSTIFALTMAGCLSGSSALATPIVAAGDSIQFADGPGTTGGGEFVLTVNGSWSFVSFCLQRTEYINFSDAFHVDAVSTFAMSDPVSNGGDGAGRDFLSPQTAFLYTQFREGTLAGYSFSGPNHVNSANALQNAIWMFEQELPMDATNAFVILANSAVQGGQWSGLGNVRVLNLSLKGVEAQDQLALVPEPTSLMLLGTGLIAAGHRFRRKKRA